MKPINYFITYIVHNLFPLNEYSEGEMKYLLDKFKGEAEDFNIKISEEDLKKYIERFDSLKNSPNILEKNLRTYSLKKLLNVIRATDNDEEEAVDDHPDIVYNEDGLIIYSGHKHGNCIKYGDGEQWCITKLTGNYATYRFGSGEPTFYLVKDENKLDDDPDSFFVLQVLNNGQYKWTDRSNSPGMSQPLSWDQIEAKFPILQGKKNLFKYIPLSKSEKSLGNNKLSYEEWAFNLPFKTKQQYIATWMLRGYYSYHSDDKDLFTDLSFRDFLRTKLNKWDKIAEWISKSYDTLFKERHDIILENYEAFKPAYRKTIMVKIHEPIDGDKIFNSALYPFSLKLDLVNKNKLRQDATNIYYKYDDDTIVRFVISNGTIHPSIYEEDATYRDIKVTSRTAKYINAYPHKEKIVSLLLNTASQNGLDPKIFNVDPDNITGEDIDVKEIDGKKVLFNYRTISAKTLSDNKSIDITGEVLDVFKEEIKTNDILQKSLISNIFKNSAILDSPNMEVLIPLVNNIPEELKTFTNDRKNNTLFTDGKNIALVPDKKDFDFEFSRFIPSHASIKDQIDLYNTYLRSNNLGFTDNEILNFIKSWRISANKKLIFAKSNPPRQENSKIKILVGSNDAVYLQNTTPGSQNYRISNRTGRLLKAKNIPRNATGAPRVPRAARTAPLAAPAQVNAPAGAGNTVRSVLEQYDLPTATTSAPLRQLFNGGYTDAIADRGAKKRTEMLRGRGHITQTLRNGQSAVYIIDFNDGSRMASVSIQPGALHFVIKTDGITQINRVADLSAALGGGVNESVQKYIIKEFLLNKYENKQDMKKIKLQELKELIQQVIKEYASQPVRQPERPGIAEPPTRTTPQTPTRRRTLTPPKEAPKTRPKAGVSENEKATLSKIVKRYKSRKNTNELLTLGSDEDERRANQSIANKKPEPGNKPGYVDTLSKNQTKKFVKKGTTWNTPGNQVYNANITKAKSKLRKNG